MIIKHFSQQMKIQKFLGVYDISDLGNIKESARFQTAPGSGAIIHNTHILNDYAITSWYKEGVVITDVARPQNPIEVGHYDTYAQGSGDGFAGCWGVYPFLPSGTIVASDINNGLYVLTPTYIRGCYLEGIITDSVSNTVLNGALIEVLSTTLTKIQMHWANTKPEHLLQEHMTCAFQKPVTILKLLQALYSQMEF